MNWKIVNNWGGQIDAIRGKDFWNPTIYIFDRVSKCGDSTSFFTQFFAKLYDKWYEMGQAYEDIARLIGTYDADMIAYDYAYNHSRDLKVSEVLLRMFNEDSENPFGDTIEVGNATTLEYLEIRCVEGFTSRFADSLRHLADALLADYNPIENYRMTEKENVGSKITITTDNENDVYGFNSANPVPSGKQSGSSISTGNKADNERDLIRSGNIGVTTSQQMIESEIALRKTHIMNILFDMMDQFFTTQIYAC